MSNFLNHITQSSSEGNIELACSIAKDDVDLDPVYISLNYAATLNPKIFNQSTITMAEKIMNKVLFEHDKI
jgi:hypothetical protein